MIVMKSRILVEAIQEIVYIFSKSKNVSVSKGKYHLLIRGNQEDSKDNWLMKRLK